MIKRAHINGRLAALQVLGLSKLAGSITSTIIPRLADPDGAAMHLAKLKQLGTSAAKNTLPAPMRTETPALTYLSWLGKQGPSANPEAVFTQQILQRQATPDILALSKKLDPHGATMPAPSYFKETG